MALESAYYNLRNLRCTLVSGLALNLVSLRIKRRPRYAVKWPGQATEPSQVWIGEDLPEITAEVFNDDVLNFAGVIPNTALDSFELLAADDDTTSFLQSDFFTKFPPGKMVFGEVETQINGDELSTVIIPIKCNVLNPGVRGGLSSGGEEEGA